MVSPSGENAGLSSMTAQSPGQLIALRSVCRPRLFTGTVQMCLLPPPPLISMLRVKARVVPSEDQVGWASWPWSSPAGGVISPVISPLATSAMRMRLSPAASPTPPGEVRVKARNLPSGENVGSVSQSVAARPSSRMGSALAPSASTVQIRSTRCPSMVSKRVTTIRRPSGV
jgi:hypothetical protein